MIESVRGKQARTRNQRLAALHTFYRHLAVCHPEMLAEAARVEAIPTKRAPPPLAYSNQSMHPMIDRHLIRDVLLFGGQVSRAAVRQGPTIAGSSSIPP
jgi:hypothetical protein